MSNEGHTVRIFVCIRQAAQLDLYAAVRVDLTHIRIESTRSTPQLKCDAVYRFNNHVC
jgi:hypothetical protein